MTNVHSVDQFQQQNWDVAPQSNNCDLFLSGLHQTCAFQTPIGLSLSRNEVSDAIASDAQNQ